jgi:hypothetical protein
MFNILGYFPFHIKPPIEVFRVPIHLSAAKMYGELRLICFLLTICLTVLSLDMYNY